MAKLEIFEVLILILSQVNDHLISYNEILRLQYAKLIKKIKYFNIELNNDLKKMGGYDRNGCVVFTGICRDDADFGLRHQHSVEDEWERGLLG